jgi:hypothetical protein
MIISSSNLCIEVASFCYRKLKLAGDVHIELLDLGDVHGYTYDNGNVEINDNLSLRDTIITICHEMVHCAQYEQTGVADEEEAYTKELVLFNAFIREQFYI